jgi:hypothetical protein
MGVFWEWLRRKGIVRRMAPYKRSEVVRMFPDYAGTVLWYGGGPVDYDDAHLPAGLVADLEAWEASYDEGLDDELEWRSRDLEKAHAVQGAELARRVAEALGSAFVIQGDRGKVRSDRPPTSPEAAAAFNALADQEEAAYNERARLVAEGAELSWSAYPPEPPVDKG